MLLLERAMPLLRPVTRIKEVGVAVSPALRLQPASDAAVPRFQLLWHQSRCTDRNVAATIPVPSWAGPDTLTFKQQQQTTATPLLMTGTISARRLWASTPALTQTLLEGRALTDACPQRRTRIELVTELQWMAWGYTFVALRMAALVGTAVLGTSSSMVWAVHLPFWAVAALVAGTGRKSMYSVGWVLGAEAITAVTVLCWVTSAVPHWTVLAALVCAAQQYAQTLDIPLVGQIDDVAHRMAPWAGAAGLVWYVFSNSLLPGCQALNIDSDSLQQVTGALLALIGSVLLNQARRALSSVEAAHANEVHWQRRVFIVYMYTGLRRLWAPPALASLSWLRRC